MEILVMRHILRVDTNRYTIEDVKEEVNECLKILKHYGFNPGTVIDVNWMDSVQSLGVTRREAPNKFSMRFNKKYFEIEDPKSIHETIMHECIHCIPGCFNHQSDFKYAASIVNKKLEFNVARTSLTPKFQTYVENLPKYRPKYQIICDNCGAKLEKLIRKTKKYNIIKAGNKISSGQTYYRCPNCHSTNLKIIDF